MIILQDTDKVNSWTKHKKYAMTVSAHLAEAAARETILEKRAERMSMCGNTVLYDILPDGKMHYAGAWLCRDRLCPICSWRLGIKRLGESIKTVQRLAEIMPKTKAIHVVLTVKNVKLQNLRETLELMSAGFARLRRRQLWLDYVKGYMKSVEITYNAEKKTYHPHMHIICIVPYYYTRQISYGDWVELWRDCMKMSYNPVIWAKHAYKDPVPDISGSMYDIDKEQSSTMSKATEAIIEATKYNTKPDELPEIAKAGEIAELALSLKALRMVSYGGIIKKIRQELGYTTDEREQLPEETIDPIEGIDRYRVIYTWATATGKYIPHISGL